MLESLVDDNGVSTPIYEQKDIGEFFLNFLDRLQDGMGENKSLIRKLMVEELGHLAKNEYDKKNVTSNNNNDASLKPAQKNSVPANSARGDDLLELSLDPQP